MIAEARFRPVVAELLQSVIIPVATGECMKDLIAAVSEGYSRRQVSCAKNRIAGAYDAECDKRE